LLTAAIDNGIFILSMHFWPHIAACQAVSRLVAGWFQFTAGKRSVFRSNVRAAPALAKYWTLVVLSGTLSFLLIRLSLSYTSTGVIRAKLIAETILFFVSFVVQRDLVFAHKSERRAVRPVQSVFLHNAPACERAVEVHDPEGLTVTK
jgi:putative flippase GtrA